VEAGAGPDEEQWREVLQRMHGSLARGRGGGLPAGTRHETQHDMIAGVAGYQVT